MFDSIRHFIFCKKLSLLVQKQQVQQCTPHRASHIHEAPCYTAEGGWETFNFMLLPLLVHQATDYTSDKNCLVRAESINYIHNTSPELETQTQTQCRLSFTHKPLLKTQTRLIEIGEYCICKMNKLKMFFRVYMTPESYRWE